MISQQLAHDPNLQHHLQPLPSIEINVGELAHQKLIDKVKRQRLLSSRFLVKGASAVTPSDLLSVSGILDPDGYEFKMPRMFCLPRPTFYSFREGYLFSEEHAPRLRKTFYPVCQHGSAGTVSEMILFFLEHPAPVRLMLAAYREVYMFGDCGGFTHSFVGTLAMEGSQPCFRRKVVESLPTKAGSRFILFEQSLDQAA
jgi:hypothetical protein